MKSGLERIFCILLAKMAKREEIKSGLEMLLVKLSTITHTTLLPNKDLGKR